MTKIAKKQKLDRPFEVQCLQYWQASMMVRRALNPATLQPLGQTPQETLAFLDRWLELLEWRAPLQGRMLDLQTILKKEVQDYDEQKLKTNS